MTPYRFKQVCAGVGIAIIFVVGVSVVGLVGYGLWKAW